MGIALSYENELQSHIKKERAAVKLSSKVGELLYDKGIELVTTNSSIDLTISEVLNLHEYSKNVVNKPVDIFTTSDLAEAILAMDLAPAKLDIGKLASEWLSEKDDFEKMTDFLKIKLTGFESTNNLAFEPRDVILYGFGRIGRLAARELIKQAGKGQQLRLKAIVVRKLTDAQIIKRADLFLQRFKYSLTYI